MHIHFSCRIVATLARMHAAVRAACRRHVAGSLLMALYATCAHAEEPVAAPVSWVCWYAGATSVACRLGAPDAFVPSGADLPSPASDAGAVLPVGKRPLPEIVRTILLHPDTLVGRTISIPLFTEARDPDFVHELAEAVMCGTRKLCHVLFLGSSTEIALALDMLDDPALN
ncbi:hypothetical protein AZOA_43850 [Azoarcus sp. Aa7]|nr:hypothetical protein [Azoarcus sp. Aa7]